MQRKQIRDYLTERPAPGPDWPFRLEELAAAALMVECAQIDGEFSAEEREAICRAVREQLTLDPETAEYLVGLAAMRRDSVWHDWLFTEVIRKHFSQDERIAVIRRLWEVATADGVLHSFEERLITRIAQELGIPQETLAASRERAGQRIRSQNARGQPIASREGDPQAQPPAGRDATGSLP